MKVGDLVRCMEAIAPGHLAASWDNVGLLVGDEASALERVLLTIDCTAAVIDEAKSGQTDAIVSYHPAIFTGQKRFVSGSIAYAAARAGIAIHSPHTALDVASGGTNDVLADAVAMTTRHALRAVEAKGESVKLVTFVPHDHIDAVSRAVFAAGAGHIGRYSSCGFRVAGTGTFFGEEGTTPVVGRAGTLEECTELRFETIVPTARLREVVGALRATHPYEEPAFDLVRLACPSEAVGMGRVGTIEPAPVAAVAAHIKSALAIDHVLVAGPVDRRISRVAVCAGSGGDLLPDAIACGVELYVTGELRHHDVLRATGAGLTVLCVLHSASERAALVPLERRLREMMPGVAVHRSLVDREPLTVA